MSANRPSTKKISRRKPWDGNAPGRGDAKERLIDAAAECLETGGVENFDVSSVALRAGVSRPTVYRYFDDREALFRAATERRANQLADSLGMDLEALEDPSEMAVLVVQKGIEMISSDPAMIHTWAGESTAGQLPKRVEGRTQAAATALITNLIEPLIRAADWEEGQETQECVETIIRFIRSFVLSPLPVRSDSELRAYLGRRLLPAIGLPPLAG